MKKSILKNIGNVIFYIFATFLLFFVVLELFLPNKTIDIIGFKGYVVVSPSMDPLIKVNDIVIVTKLEDTDLEIGQVITFHTYLPTNQQDGQGNTIYIKSRVTHYLADFYEEDGKMIIKTKSYNKYHDGGSFDSWNNELGQTTDITMEDVIGKVKLTIPFLGVIITLSSILVRNPIFLGLIMLNIVIIVVLVKYLKKSKEKPDDVAGPDSK